MRSTKMLVLHRTIKFLSGAAILLVGSLACGTEPTPPTAQNTVIESIERFGFSSGGAYHPEGFGEWQIQLDRSGFVEIQYILDDEHTDYGRFNLTPGENTELWKKIEAADFQGLSIPERSGLPDEVQLTFTIDTTTTHQDLHIWLNDLNDYDTISALVDQIAIVIETYTGERPILK